MTDRSKRQKDIADRLAANKARLRRYMAGDKRALDSWTDEEVDEVKHEEPVQTKTDPEQWNDWLDQRCTEIINAKLENFADIMGEVSGQNEQRWREELRSLRKPWREQLYGDLLKKFSGNLDVMKTDILNVLRHSIADEMKQVRKDLGIADGDVIDLPNFKRHA